MGKMAVELRALSFVVTDRDGPEYSRISFNWRIWAHGTSFYLAVRQREMSEMKISLHGPDPRPGMEPVFRLGLDSSFQRQDDVTYGALVVNGSDPGWPIKFTAQMITSKVRRVVRFSYPAEMFGPHAPNGLQVNASKKKRGNDYRQAKFTAPGAGGLYVDLYIAEPAVDPYWEDPVLTEQSNAGLGPLVNAAGQSLTLVAKSVDDPHLHDPNWQDVSNEDIEVMSQSAVVRALVMNKSSTGLLWIREKIAPATFGPDDDALHLGVSKPSWQK